MNNNQIDMAKIKQLRDLAEEVSDTTVENANTYPVLTLCDELVKAIDKFL